MTTTLFYQVIGLDSKLTALNKKLDKKMFYDYADLNKKEKDVITKYIDRIELAYLLTPSTINIQPFINEDTHYEGVMFINVRLRDEATEKLVAIIEEVIHGALPNPVVLTFHLKENLLVSTCMKRLNKVDKSSVVLGDVHRTFWLNLEHDTKLQNQFIKTIHVSNLNFNNFFVFYKDIDLAVEAAQNAETIGSFHIERDHQKQHQQQKIIQQIKDLELEVVKLKSAIKKETQFNKKVELNVKIQQIKKRTEQLKKELV
ncbi:DUF4391 domain-containing protein [Priestia flexa]|uniref:DUF4391 domain-containing protein n=1 Tax=Priestia flexa TaxID=86664 RepID=UPI00240D2472|nr:DUF4391 domain-containing protein [Priestia flexa]WEZ08573.1 DUF4391 domain-containing protein [Priestia flexa]